MALPERKGVYALRDTQFTLIGPEIKVGQKAPNFTALAKGFKPVTLADSKGKVRILASVPSLETGVCTEETRKFNQMAAELPESVTILTISMDTPFTQDKWCGANNVTKVTTVSDMRDREFGQNYGVYVKETGLLARAVFVVDKNDIVRHVEYVPQMPQLPNLDAAVSAAKKAASA